MRRLRDLFYIYGDFEESYYYYYGMEFSEFIRHCPIEIPNIMITDGMSIANHCNHNWHFETATGVEEYLEMAKEDLYSMGNFHWLDYSSEEGLNACTPQEKAEVLYLSKYAVPLKNAFLDKLGNQFVYLAHDDGWFCKLYCKEMVHMKEIIGNKVMERFSTNKRRKVLPLSEAVKDKLFELTREGLLLDLTRVETARGGDLWVRVHAIGKFQDMDEMYNNREKHKAHAKACGELVYSKKVWKLELY